MRQALIIKNPKWQLYTEAVSEFQKTDAPAVLVVRANCKEKKLSPVAPAQEPEAKTKKK